MEHHAYIHDLLLILVTLSQANVSWSWLFSHTKEVSNQAAPSSIPVTFKDRPAEFTVEPLNDLNGLKLVENAKNKMSLPNSCWQNAYKNVFEGCAKTLANEELRSRLAWHLSDCFQQHSGRLPFPHCNAKSQMKKCLQTLDSDAHKVYLEYFLETNSICHQLQADAFKPQTERLVNELKISAENAEEKLAVIKETGELLLENSKQVYDSLTSIDIRTQEVAKTSKQVEDQINSVLTYSEAVYEQSKGIAASQDILREGQVKMKEKLEEGMSFLQDSYNHLGVEISTLRDETVEIEKEISRVGEAMFTRIRTLQERADDIGDVVGVSLEKQKKLLDGQSEALDGLNFLTRFQSQALEESRETLKKLAEFGHKQQEELLQKQEQLQQTHDRLVESSKIILSAQEAFESRQAHMFIAMDKLLALHNALLLESRVIKAVLVYSSAILVIYLLTSTKHTYNVRHRFYVGLSLTFLAEVGILRYVPNDGVQQARMINLVRSLFMILAPIQYLYAIFTYRDYEVLNHTMLLTLIEKVNSLQGNRKLMPWEMDTESESEVNWCSWIDSELPEDVNKLEDPDYLLPEEVAENSIEITPIVKKYNLRHRPSSYS